MIPKREEQQLHRLNADLDQLFQQLDGYSDEQLNRQPSPETWSPLMVARHLMLAEAYSLQYIRKKLSFTDELPPAGIRSRLRSLVLEFYFGSPFKWKAPKAIGDSALLREAPYELGTIKSEWLEQRAQLRELLESFPAGRYREEVYKHPFVGRLSPTGLLRFFQGHFNRHSKQIRQRLA
ncbi:DinB family protein [Flavilitoribacter nigricans]|uniref:DinB-like domain-containing protein n=1 Tax=Flavilitoribacter nigricans (strain ATCC 23147 / DSM 23189 / NBRC 102662 / NCIMB 1420 / SS-2) TaxID=1122177 RepID=A0A2D0N8V2_FLAN2|nr:DinB family protein [Flavilitoribacter nigricans]PHN04941.1 hypothetical protein CRP01_18085 [Flavilitoribacter nigricans DSM 23189 = NBRC 102662]